MKKVAVVGLGKNKFSAPQEKTGVVIVQRDDGPWILGNLEGLDPKTASMELIGKKDRMEHKLFPGDKYYTGESALPVFHLN